MWLFLAMHSKASEKSKGFEDNFKFPELFFQTDKFYVIW